MLVMGKVPKRIDLFIFREIIVIDVCIVITDLLMSTSNYTCSLCNRTL